MNRPPLNETLRPAIGLLPVVTIALSLVGLLAAGTQVNLTVLVGALARVPVSSMALAVGLHLIIALLLAWRWHFVLRAYQARIHWPDVLGPTFVGLLLNMTLPGAVGGDVGRGLIGHRRGLPWATAVGSQLLDRVVGLVVLGVLLTLASLHVGMAGVPWPVQMALLLVLPSALVALILGGRMARVLYRFDSLYRQAVALGEGFASIVSQASLLLPAIVLSLAGHLLSVLAAVVIAEGAGLKLGFIEGIALFLPAMLVAQLPVSVGGWGVREVATIALFAQAGIAAEGALVVAVLFALAQTSAAVFGTALWTTFGGLGAEPRARASTGRKALPWAVTALLLIAALLAYFHNRFWWAPDEGVYGYVAQRILAGDVLNGNLQDLHPGYVGFLHAAAMAIFGDDLVSMRYPLVAATLLQSAIAFWLLSARGSLYAAIGSVGVAALSFIQFLNPSANWYALAMAFALVGVLSRGRPRSWGQLVLIGAILATTLLLRQLSGVILAIGAFTYLLSESEGGDGSRWLARTLLAVMGAGVAVYLWLQGSFGGTLLFGVWPIALICVAVMRSRIDDAETLRLIGWIAAGGLLLVLPLLAYHAWHGTLPTWIEDTVYAPLHLVGLEFMEKQRYWILAFLAASQIVEAPGLAAVASSLFYLTLLLMPVALGGWLSVSGMRGPRLSWHPLPVVAVFFALVSTHYEIPIYLVFSSSLSLAGLLWLGGSGYRARALLGTAALGLIAVGILLQAGQPLSRRLGGIVAGVRVELDATAMLPNASLVLESRDLEMYAPVLALINTYVPAGAGFLAFPVNPELHFMSGRPAIYRFNSTAIGIRDTAALSEALAEFDRVSPPLVIHDPKDKYNNWASHALLDHVKARYRLSEQLGRFDIYLPK